jgi:hypothetical protein
LAVINNEYAVKRLHRLTAYSSCTQENPAYPPMSFQEYDELMNALNGMKPQVVSQARRVRRLPMLMNHSISRETSVSRRNWTAVRIEISGCTWLIGSSKIPQRKKGIHGVILPMINTSSG